MLESSEVEGGEAVAAVSSMNSSATGSSEEGGGGGEGALKEGSTLGRLELARISAALCLRNVAPMGAIICTGSDA